MKLPAVFEGGIPADWSPLLSGQDDLIADVRARATRYVVAARSICRYCGGELAQFVYFMDANEESIERGVVVWRSFNMTRDAAVMVETTPGEGEYVSLRLAAASHAQPVTRKAADRVTFAGWAVVTEYLTGHPFEVHCPCPKGKSEHVTPAEMHASTKRTRTVRV